MNMKTTRYISMFAAALMLFGCQAHGLSYQGAQITRQTDIIPLPMQKAAKGIWKTNELSVDYTGQSSGQMLQIAGVVKLVGGFAVGFNAIDRLAVQVLFLDDQGTVLADAVMYSIQGTTPSDLTPLRFDRSFPIPAGTRAISFAYDGELSDGGGIPRFPARAGGDRTQVKIGYFPP